MALYLFSPATPLRTGTANYFKLVLQELKVDAAAFGAIRIVVDRKYYQHADLTALPYPAVDFHDLHRTQQDVSIYFLANNEYHRYIHRALYDHRPDDGTAVSVVHEPDMWMNVQAMCNLREYGFREEDMNYFAAYEFGADTELFCDLFARGQVDQNFEYASVAGTHIYEHSDVIVFHSLFARSKFLLEKSVTYKSQRTNEPVCLVMSHPPEQIELPHAEHSIRTNKFIAGTYGWLKKVKQVEPLIRAFNEFYEGLSAEDQENIELHLVGQVDEERDFDPVGLANRLPAHDHIKFFGYVDNDTLDSLMASASIIFSLRFPSCGETSGPLRKAEALGVPVALSQYAAFAEEVADYHVSVNPDEQNTQLVNILRKEFEYYKQGKARPTRRASVADSSLDVNEMLDKVLAFKDNRGN